eukprot:SAG22_NODE_4485_length_1255_cov_1.282872_2_plen_83_part_01
MPLHAGRAAAPRGRPWRADTDEQPPGLRRLLEGRLAPRLGRVPPRLLPPRLRRIVPPGLPARLSRDSWPARVGRVLAGDSPAW